MLVSEVSSVEEWKERQIKSGRWQSMTPDQANSIRHQIEEHITPEEIGKMAASAGVKTVVLTHLPATADPKDEYQRFGGNLSYCFTGAWDLSEHCRALIRRPNYWVEKATAAHATHPKCYEFQRYLG
jgi:hypothetical protein